MVVFKTRFASQVCHLQLVRSARLLKVQFTEGELCSADGVAKRIGTGKGGYIYIYTYDLAPRIPWEFWYYMGFGLYDIRYMLLIICYINILPVFQVQ